MAAALLAATAAFAPADATAQAPRVDLTFAGGGTMTLPWTTSNLDREVIASAPDGGTFIAFESEQDIRLIRLDVSGQPVASYVGGGIARLSVDEPLYLSAIHVESDGSLLLGGRRDVIRVDPTGRIDRSFGTQGRTRVPYVTDGVCAGARMLRMFSHNGGWLLVATQYYFQTIFEFRVDFGCTFVARLRPDGTPDLTFGVNGNTVRSHVTAFDAALRDDYIELIGRYDNRAPVRVERMRLDGSMLESFGVSGTKFLAENGPSVYIMADGRILPDGSLVFVAVVLRTVTVYRYRPDHTVDFAFAGSGRSGFELRNHFDPWANPWEPRVLPVADGGFLVRINGFLADPPVGIADLYKVDAGGRPDASFGDGGLVRYRSSGFARISAWLMQPDGFLVNTAAFGSAVPGPPPSPVSGLQSPYVAVNAQAQRIQAVPDLAEFRNAVTNHYFIAYDGPEAAGIDGGAAGPGWQRTQESFRPGGPSPVCRFYNPGANTHFFTAEPGECEDVKHSSGWSYEGLGFYATRLSAGKCTAPLKTVYRLFNNRQRFNDSNHRYVTDLSLVPAMVAQGWSLEGPVFCAKP